MDGDVVVKNHRNDQVIQKMIDQVRIGSRKSALSTNLARERLTRRENVLTMDS